MRIRAPRHSSAYNAKVAMFMMNKRVNVPYLAVLTTVRAALMILPRVKLVILASGMIKTRTSASMPLAKLRTAPNAHSKVH